MNPSRTSRFRKWWLERFRLSLQEHTSYSQRWQIGVSRWGVALAGATLVSGIAALTYFAVAHTPLREWVVPGYLAQSARNDAQSARQTADSALRVLDQQSRYLAALSSILRGEVPETGDLAIAVDSMVTAEIDLDFGTEPTDSALRARIAEEDRFALRRQGAESIHSRGMSFRPVNGPASANYDATTGHYGVDFVAPEGATIHAVDDGTVLMASYTVDGGYVIAIQHKADRISIYKHNQSLLHEPGDVVRAGEAIAILGGTGTTSMGPHCHFEWWVDGAPLDPTPWLPGLNPVP